MNTKNNLRLETQVVRGTRGYDPITGAVSFPIYQSATFRHPALNESTGYDYSRVQNPTREELEQTVAILENGRYGFAHSSGMAAIGSIMKLFGPRDHIIVSDDLYGGTYRMFQEIYTKYGITFSYVNTSSADDVSKAINDQTRAVIIETPSNPMMKITDIETIGMMAKEKGILTIVDNTFLTPYLQRPLKLGADIVIHSGTKFLGGHNDTLSGFVVVNDQKIAEKLQLAQKTEGAVLSPLDSWLMLRGIKTLAVRMEKQEQNALKIACWLKEHPKIEHVYYPGLPEHPGHLICRKQASGFGAVLSFNLTDTTLVEKVLRNIELILFAESLGGVETLITYPYQQTHSAIPIEIREKTGVRQNLLRLSVGIEAADDLISDLTQALGS